MCTSCVPIHPSSYRTVVYSPYGYIKDTVIACVKFEIEGTLHNFYVASAGSYYRLFHTESLYLMATGNEVAQMLADFKPSLWNIDDIQYKLRENASYHLTSINGPFGRTIVDWKYREAQRLQNGEYLPLPELGIPFNPDHFIHRSIEKDQDDYVAYTPSDAYGLQNRQTRIRLGRYLKKYFPDMSDVQIVAVVDRFKAALARESAPFELKFTTDPDIINEIFETKMYANGSSCESCMYGKFYGWKDRPYHVYADSPDVAVAYLVRMDEIVARSVVSTKDNLWVRLYSIDAGESTLCKVLREKLEAARYEHGDLEGNRLTMLPKRNGRVVLPYIDGSQWVEESAGYWVVGDSGDYCAERTDGYGEEEDEPCCSRCENPEDECSCIFCECCDEYFADGCEECSMCPECDRCVSHDRCTCERCSDCNEIVSPRLRYTDRCDCDRCDECNALADDCECEKCEECDELTENCTCEPEEKEETNEPTYPVGDVNVPAASVVAY